jgi:hypothetical protein
MLGSAEILHYLFDQYCIIIDLQENGCGVWTGLSWLRIETVDEHL